MPGKFRRHYFTAVATLALLVSLLSVRSTSAQIGGSGGTGPATNQSGDCQTFEATGKTVCNRFLDYWKEHGQLAQQGYPVSTELSEVSETDGKTYTMQYFERAVFELHPENKAPNDVLLSLLGTMAFKQKYPNGVTELPASTMPGPSTTFNETGKTVRGVFLDYWKNHGGLAQQGYPISGLVREISPLNGKEYVMQYFQRAVFELHPENKAPYDVLLSQLGTMKYQQKYAGNPPGNTNPPLSVGSWGGDHIAMDVETNTTTIEFDCAHATITGTWTLSDGKVSANGTYYQEHPGPVRAGEENNGEPAQFTGTLTGTTLTLNIVLTNRNVMIGPLTLMYGQRGRIMKCL